MTGTDLIAIERQRQITEEGYDAAHDAGHAEDLARAAACYATPALDRDTDGRSDVPVLWPWEARYWKPGVWVMEDGPTPDDRIRELVKAGALIAAAIDAGLRASGGTER